MREDSEDVFLLQIVVLKELVDLGVTEHAEVFVEVSSPASVVRLDNAALKRVSWRVYGYRAQSGVYELVKDLPAFVFDFVDGNLDRVASPGFHSEEPGAVLVVLNQSAEGAVGLGVYFVYQFIHRPNDPFL